jgi:hypothetical protein
MGAKTCILAYSDGDARDHLKAAPILDRSASGQLAADLFPNEQLEPLEDGDLFFVYPPNNEICVGCFPGISMIAAHEFGIDYPSSLPLRFLQFAGSRSAILHSMHSVVDWFAFAIWRSGKLERSLSLSPESGILENIGEPLPFELPFWSGAHPAINPTDIADDDEPYPFPFHPLELGEAALAEMFGFQIEGFGNVETFDLESVPLARFKRKRQSKFKFWKW